MASSDLTPTQRLHVAGIPLCEIPDNDAELSDEARQALIAVGYVNGQFPYLFALAHLVGYFEAAVRSACDDLWTREPVNPHQVISASQTAVLRAKTTLEGAIAYTSAPAQPETANG